MRRGLAWMLALAFLVGGAAACGDDDDDGGEDAATEESGEGAADEGGDSGGDEGGDSGGEEGGNAAIQEFCDAVQEVVDKSAELQDDPTNADLQAEVTGLTSELGQQATELAADAAGFTPEEAAQFEGCQTDLSGIGG